MRQSIISEITGIDGEARTRRTRMRSPRELFVGAANVGSASTGGGMGSAR